MENSHRWTFVGYFSTQQVPIGLPGRTDGRTAGRQAMYTIVYSECLLLELLFCVFRAVISVCILRAILSWRS